MDRKDGNVWRWWCCWSMGTTDPSPSIRTQRIASPDSGSQTWRSFATTRQTGLVLDGWLFDLSAAPDAARAIVARTVRSVCSNRSSRWPSRPVSKEQPMYLKRRMTLGIAGGEEEPRCDPP